MCRARARLRTPSVPSNAATGALRSSAVGLLLTLALAAAAPADTARTTFTYPVIGFEDDVDLVVSPGGRFVVVCQEDETGVLPPQVEIIEIDEATGAFVAPRLVRLVLGFEHGVDPFIVPQSEDGAGWGVFIPHESEDGLQAGILALRLNDDGTLIEEVSIDLGPLGFRPDVDGTWAKYNGPALAVFPLESADGSLRGVLAMDPDATDSDLDGDGEFGVCHLVSNAALGACDMNTAADWIPGLVEAVDPVAYEVPDCCVRTALPVTGAGGSDLLLIDFDPHFEPPVHLGYTSVKDFNAGGALPLAFPGYERDVDISVIKSAPVVECGVAFPEQRVLIPVEGDGSSDLYLIDGNGLAQWTYSSVGGTVAPIPGYEQGVDLSRLCDLPVGPPHRILVPVEDEISGDADVLVVNFADGSLVGHVEDPLINPGVTVLGFEVGVEPLVWTPGHILVPMEGAGGAGLLTIDLEARVVSALVGPPVTGFARSVDPITAPPGDPDPSLYIPISTADGGDSDVLRVALPPDVGGPASLETLNPAVTFSGFEWDVDLGLLRKSVPGGAFVMIPEENADGTSAQLRFEAVPNLPVGRVLAVPTPEAGVTPAKMHTFRTSDGLLIGSLELLGLETGLDLANGRGPAIRRNPPDLDVPAGYDADTDPTLAWDLAGVGVPRPSAAGEAHLSFANPFRAPGRIEWRQPEPGPVRLDVVDIAGRRVRMLYEGWSSAGPHAVEWDGRAARAGKAGVGVYFVRMRSPFLSTQRTLILIR